MDIIVVDDEPLARERLKRMVTQLGEHVVGEAGNAETALLSIEQHDPAVVLLDIEMPGESGLTLAKSITGLDAPPAIIFTTAYDQYALDAFETLACGYLLKPIQEEKLKNALEQAKSVSKLQLEAINGTGSNTEEPNHQKRERISAKTHRGIELIAVEEIRYFKADQKYVEIICVDKQVLIDETLKELEKEFAGDFIRVHRNALVSVKNVQALERDQDGGFYLRLADIDSNVTVSRRYSTKIKALLKKL
jgi:two-component system response regulator AlgR